MNNGMSEREIQSASFILSYFQLGQIKYESWFQTTSQKQGE